LAEAREVSEEERVDRADREIAEESTLTPKNHLMVEDLINEPIVGVSRFDRV
jgi:hypothetical protein